MSSSASEPRQGGKLIYLDVERIKRMSVDQLAVVVAAYAAMAQDEKERDDPGGSAALLHFRGEMPLPVYRNG